VLGIAVVVGRLLRFFIGKSVKGASHKINIDPTKYSFIKNAVEFIVYIIAFIIRINVGFASLTMGEDLGLSSEMLGWGAGLFFISYFFFEVPSNLMLHKFGARRWIARVMISMGLVSMGFVFVQGASSLYLMRLLLGIADVASKYYIPGVGAFVIYALMIVILASVLVVMLDSVPWIAARYRGVFHALEWIFTAFFTIEYVVRLACVRRPLASSRSNRRASRTAPAPSI